MDTFILWLEEAAGPAIDVSTAGNGRIVSAFPRI